MSTDDPEPRAEVEYSTDLHRKCPFCDTRIEDVKLLGPVHVRYDPCGHQVDQRRYDE